MESYKKRLVELVSNLAFEYKDYPAVIPYSPSKCRLCPEDPTPSRLFVPEAFGIPSDALTSLLSALEADEGANVHSIVVSYREQVLLRASRPGYSSLTPHLAHSMSKSVTAILIMLLIDDKKLDTGTAVCDFFPEYTPTDERARELTVEHLLTMSSGVGFGEAGVVSETEWTRAFIEAELSFAPGERFAYNSMNSYMLMHIADRICNKEYGISAESFLYDRLFLPLGIPRPLWESSPEGIPKGGFGLYLSADSFAKIGAMLLGGGVYRERRILSESVVVEATSTQAITPERTGDFNYGYHIWTAREGNDFLFNGMLGQNVWVSPDNGIVVALTSGNNELFSKGSALRIIREHLLPIRTGARIHRPLRAARALDERVRRFFDSRCWLTPKKPTGGILAKLGLREREPFDPAFDSLLGEYLFPRNNQGIFPAFVRVMQSNYQGGMRSLRFERRGEGLYMTSLEGECEITVELGLYSYKRSEIDLSGEKYAVMAMASALEEDNGSIIYKIELAFPELPNTRRLTLSLSPLGRLLVGMREIPDDRIAAAYVDAIPTLSGKAGFLYGLLERNLGKNFIEGKVRELFSPTLTAISAEAPDRDAALAELNDATDERIASSALVRRLIFSFLGNGEKTKDTGTGALGRLAGLLGKFF